MMQKDTAMKIFPFFFLIPVLFCSCFNLTQDEKDDEPVYTPEIVWQTKVNYRLSWAYPFESDGYGYYPEESTFFSTATSYYARLVKIDLNNSDIMWKTEDVPARYTDQAQKIGEHIYFSLRGQDIIMVYNDDDGSLAATVSLNQNTPSMYNRNGPRLNHTAVWDKYIFWENSDEKPWDHQGLMRFNTSHIDFDIDPEEEQLIEPELVWRIDWQAGINANIVVKEGIVYFLTSRHWFEGGTVEFSYLVAVDAVNGAEKWVIKRDHGWGNRENSLVVDGDRLYVIDRNPCCYNRKTGEVIFEKKDDVYEYSDAGAELQGISFYKDKLYYTTGMHSRTHLQDSTADPKRVKNIICIDGENGDLVWGDLVPGGATIYTFPLVNKGKAYVVTDRGLRVYDAETGKLLGVDKTVENTGRNHNLLYKDLVIYPDYKGGGMEDGEWYAWLTAIRAE